MKKFILITALLVLPLVCFGQELKIDDETKAVCNELMSNIFQDILKIKDKYKQLENFDKSALEFDKNSGLSQISYSYDIIALRKDEHSKLGENPFSFYIRFAPIDAQFQTVNSYEQLFYPNLKIKFYGSFINQKDDRGNLNSKIYEIVKNHSKLLSELDQSRLPLQLTIKTDKQVYEVGEGIAVELQFKNLSSSDISIKYDKNSFFNANWIVNSRDAHIPVPATATYESTVIKSGEVFSKRLDLNSSENYLTNGGRNWPRIFCCPGKYDITFTNWLDYLMEDKEKRHKFTSNTITIEVVRKKESVPQ